MHKAADCNTLGVMFGGFVTPTRPSSTQHSFSPQNQSPDDNRAITADRSGGDLGGPINQRRRFRNLAERSTSGATDVGTTDEDIKKPAELKQWEIALKAVIEHLREREVTFQAQEAGVNQREIAVQAQQTRIAKRERAVGEHEARVIAREAVVEEREFELDEEDIRLGLREVELDQSRLDMCKGELEGRRAKKRKRYEIE